jgi:SAM-dependent methyltransferase
VAVGTDGGGVPADAVAFVCPLCRGPLIAKPEAFACPPCARSYPLHDGIPDFRIFPDPYLGIEEDRDRTARVLEALHRYDLRGLLEYDWSLSDITPVALRGRFIRGALQGEAKARRFLRLLEDGSFPGSSEARSVLEIGSGTGALLTVAAERFPRVVGVDIAMRWLHVSRRRFLDRGLPAPPLVCACAERLPFPAGSFDLVVSAATLEVTRDPGAALAECARVLAPRGTVLLNTGNRFSLAPEPHVQLRGVGFLPRRWQGPYVRWRRGVDFSKIRPVSLRELDRLASPLFRTREVLPADAPDETVTELPALQRAQVALYRGLKRRRFLRPLLLRIAPEWDVRLAGPAADGPGTDAT